MADVEVEEAAPAPEAAAPAAGDGDAKRAEMERKKAEVRKRLEESGKAGKKAKKGFLTPERKKKLRKLLMVKAAEELKSQQLQKEQERQKILAQRVIPCPNVEGINDQAQLLTIYEDLFQRMCKLEDEKYDMNLIVRTKESEINELTIAVNDLRGKFVKPTLKKVSKYDNKFKKMAEEGEGKTAEPKADFRSNLKVVKREAVEDIMAKKTKQVDKPDWKKKGPEDSKKEEVKEEAAPPPAEEAAPAEEAPAEEPPAEEAAPEEEGEEEEGEEEEEEE